MAASDSERRAAGRRKMLRTRLLVFFIAPVLLLGAGTIVLAEIMLGASGAAISAMTVRILYAVLLLLGLLLATGLALYVGERVTQPIAWLLRAMDAGQLRLPGGRAPVAADWEIGVLAQRVQVLLQQNLSGAQAVEQLDVLRDEIAAVLHEATEGALDPRAWPHERASHALTRQLLDYFRTQAEETDTAIVGLRRLQGLLEQDWREETRCIEEIVGRTERTFVEQTRVAMELEKLERALAGGAPEPATRADEPAPAPDADPLQDIGYTLGELRLGFERWAGEREAEGPIVAGAPAPRSERLKAWSTWVAESLTLIEQSLGAVSRRDLTAAAPMAQTERMRARLRELSALAAQASQGMGALAREAAQLQRTWERLGERLRSLMARAIDARDGSTLRALALGDEDEHVQREDEEGGTSI